MTHFAITIENIFGVFLTEINYPDKENVNLSSSSKEMFIQLYELDNKLDHYHTDLESYIYDNGCNKKWDIEGLDLQYVTDNILDAYERDRVNYDKSGK